MSTPIYDRLEARMKLALAGPKKPEQTLLIGVWSIWCVVCEAEDFTHEHPENPRAPRIGDRAVFPSVEEAAWLNEQRAGRPFAMPYKGPFRRGDG